MANLSIASKCNRSCSYCFAMDMLEEMPDSQSNMSFEQYERALDFLQRSGIDEVRLLGGEPTLHPNFIEMTRMALAHDMTLLIFSGGLIPNRVLYALEKMGGKMKLLLNVLYPDEGRPSEHARQREVFKRLRNRVMLGVNIFNPAVELDFIIDLIQEYGLLKCVRLGIAHPEPENQNDFLHPNHYPEVGYRATEFAIRAGEGGISIDFDCGWVPCMFPNGALEYLGLSEHQVGLTCSPIFDILSDGQTIACYPLFNHARKCLPENHNAAWLRSQFEAEQRQDRIVTLYNKCSDCKWLKQDKCRGGCLAASMRRYRRKEFSFQVHEGNSVATNSINSLN